LVLHQDQSGLVTDDYRPEGGVEALSPPPCVIIMTSGRRERGVFRFLITSSDLENFHHLNNFLLLNTTKQHHNFHLPKHQHTFPKLHPTNTIAIMSTSLDALKATGTVSILLFLRLPLCCWTYFSDRSGGDAGMEASGSAPATKR